MVLIWQSPGHLLVIVAVSSLATGMAEGVPSSKSASAWSAAWQIFLMPALVRTSFACSRAISIVVAFLLATAPSMPSFAVFSSAMAVATVVDSAPSFARQVEVEVQQSWTMELGVIEPDASK